jgi:short-subunit dehydrogenase
MNIIITGGLSGLGYNLVKILSENEENKIFILSREREHISTFNSNVEILFCDINLIDKVDYNFKKIVEITNNQIDILICNAAISNSNSYLNEISFESFKKVINNNFISHVYLIKKILPIMLNRNNGHIVNISSGTGIFGIQKLSAYSCSKSALQSLFESLHFEYKKNNIYFKNFFPGMIDTNFEKKNNILNNLDLYKKKDPFKAAQYISKNIMSKKLNNFYQFKTIFAFLLKIYPFSLKD